MFSLKGCRTGPPFNRRGKKKGYHHWSLKLKEEKRPDNGLTQSIFFFFSQQFSVQIHLLTGGSWLYTRHQPVSVYLYASLCPVHRTLLLKANLLWPLTLSTAGWTNIRHLTQTPSIHRLANHLWLGCLAQKVTLGPWDSPPGIWNWETALT